MEGMQYIQHRVVDGTYRAVLHWRGVNGVVLVKQADGSWLETTIPVNFVKDYEPPISAKEKI